jgi:hypothetical protein
MGIISNTVSMRQYRVEGSLPKGDLFQWASELLATHAFRSIDNTLEETSWGWVHIHEHQETGFEDPHAFLRDRYLALTLRLDQRKLPSALVKARRAKAEEEFLEANPGFKRVPKNQKEELRERVKIALFSKVLPVPSTYDAVWDTKTGTLIFASLGKKVIELFEGHFHKTFQGMRLILIHPYSRAESVLPKELIPALRKANQTTADDVVSLMEENKWIGWDFLLWLMYRTKNSGAKYEINRPGLLEKGATFISYLNNRIMLKDDKGEGGKITIVGPQTKFREARMALREDKKITEAAVYMEKDEQTWKLILKGETFDFASFKCPPVKLERDEEVDEISEREAIFFERMSLLEQGLQKFDSLFSSFLQDRLDKEWTKKKKQMENWVASEN